MRPPLSKPIAQPKDKSRLQVKTKQAKAEKTSGVAWALAVFARDKYRCRMCGRAVVQTIDRISQRAEAHHLRTRTVQEVRYDVRNGLTLDASCHEKVTGKINERWTISGTEYFAGPSGRLYINGDCKVTFERVA